MTPRLLAVALMLSAAHIAAQPSPPAAGWELLIEKPLPEGAIPNIHIVDLPLRPASGPRPEVKGHTHAGPVFGYVAKGEVEILVDPDPPASFKTDEVFYETPGHVHHYLRSLSSTNPAEVIAYNAGYEGGAAAVIKVLHHDDLVTITNQVVRLFRLTLAPGGTAEVPSHANPDAISVLEGKVEVAGASPQRTYGPAEFFARPATYTPFVLRNTSDSERARILVYQVIEKGAAIPAR